MVFKTEKELLYICGRCGKQIPQEEYFAFGKCGDCEDLILEKFWDNFEKNGGNYQKEVK